MDEFELEDNLEFILQSIQELIEDQGENNPFGEVNQNELLANLVNYDQDNLMPDVSVEDVVNGKDVQGIPWEKMLFPRDQYREMKMKGYKNYQNLSYAREDALQDCKQVERDGPYYDFQYNTRRARLSIVHFQLQLRNLVWATTKHDVYTVHNQSMTHWSSLNQISTELINGDDCIIPKQRGHGSQSVSMVQFTTMAVDNDLLVVGGFHGELICKRLEDDGIVFSTRVTDDENAITNSLEIYQDPNGSRRLVVANNDCSVRIFDTKYFDLLNHYVFPWSVNSVSVNPDGTLFAVLGDHEDGLVVDPKCGKMAIYWLPGVKTQHVGCGTLETYHNPWLSLVEG
uniref:WD repeat-containing protein n=2 Tax=Aegilops tauschii subsp. strangulata TaxID=200361 RepID=A0A453RV14_AEGTS